MVSGGNRQLLSTGKNASQGLCKGRELQHHHNHIVLVTLYGVLQECILLGGGAAVPSTGTEQLGLQGPVGVLQGGMSREERRPNVVGFYSCVGGI